ncbi:hypothetical protein IUY40_19150, partial [Flavobacterium sp. ALJ2]|uniref:Calx-beta domain-containing protein n=1 Tax=Flavobacterium sp. ALJ2 TaxID=2786960 RepID=UPI001E56BA6E
TSDADYTALTGTATIPAGSGTAEIKVNTLLDKLIESDETIIITGVATTGFTWSATANTATVTITDSNPASHKLLFFSAWGTSKTLKASPPVIEKIAEGTSIKLKVSLSPGVTATSDITFNYAVDGTATSGDDYTPLTGVGTIPAGNNSVDIIVTALTDAVIEDDETVILTGGVITAGSLTGFGWVVGVNDATITITDVTDEANKVLHFSPTTAEVAEGSSTSVKVSLPEGVTMGYPQIVNYTVSGTATSDTDYTALTGSVTIPAGDGYAMIAVTAKNDNLIEPDETVVITGGTVSGFTWGSDNVATVTIKDATGT